MVVRPAIGERKKQPVGVFIFRRFNDVRGTGSNTVRRVTVTLLIALQKMIGSYLVMLSLLHIQRLWRCLVLALYVRSMTKDKRHRTSGVTF